jgi:Tfp pilus assembly protein PilP
MRTHRALFLMMVLCALGVTLAGLAGMVAAQQQPPQPQPEAAAPPQEPEATPGPDIDQILEGEEEVLSGNGFTYDPGNRRDPFKSLLIEQQARDFRGPRPEGIPGLLIDEIDLTGVWRTSRGFVAQVVASNQKKTYLLKEGDQLYDGDVVSINKKEVVFKQIVQDPTALKPFREVVKSLTPS